MIKAILFDCFGVLTETAWDQLIGALTPQEQRAVTDARKAFDRGFSSYKDFEKAIQESSSISPLKLRQTFLLRRGFHRNEKLLSYITELHKDYKLGVLSNAGTDWLRNDMLKPEEQGLFDIILLSHDVGMIKPEPNFFLLACQKLAHRPEEVVMVDDRQYNIAAAKKLGMKGILYTNFIQFKHELEELITESLANPDH